MRPTTALARRIAFAAFARIRSGHLLVVEDDRCFGFGDPRSGLRATVEIRDPRAYSWLLRGSTGLGEGYVDGLWSSEDLVELSRIACRNMGTIDVARRRLQPVIGPAQRAARLIPENTRSGARKNISAHYDLGNDLFESFLDTRMMYSAAVYGDPETSLEDAQVHKLDRICEALDLRPEDHLLEVGTGWGGLAIHAASTRGCRVTTTTISREQHALASSRVREAGLADRVEVLLRDYRDLEGSYDKLVSIEMIEAVGWQYFDEYFAKCAALLAPDGAFFLQAIVIGDEAYEAEKAARSFANKHIFPGGCLPSVRLISELGAANGTPVADADEITDDYVLTLAEWRRRFNDAWPRLEPLGYDERFRRLWNFYLAFSEGGFSERRIRDFQLLLAKADWDRPGVQWRSRTIEREAAALSS